MERLKNIIETFREERGWKASDTPAILAKSIIVEAAELLECYQFSEENVDLESVKSELADVLMYALSLAYDLDWNVTEIIEEKLVDVARRYPKV
ncbi:MAG: nucleotide pyrophosphohydrolase [Erysipelotrichaceae bacterium]|nr:nucleotide pyrophosphohydrolase [Erysipelotrichaceae bacterium]MBR3693515.1 nucleotide pyrophosphohydrolase [Erysipelotrichales bacterium]